MKSNPIGHTIFFTREKYRMTNHKHDTIFFSLVKKIVSDFTAIS